MNRRAFLKLGLATAASVIPAGTLFAVQSSQLEISHQRVSFPGLAQRVRIVAIGARPEMLVVDLEGR